MESKTARIRAVKHALFISQHAAAFPSAHELHLLTRFVLGELNLEQANELLRAHGRTLLARPNEQFAW